MSIERLMLAEEALRELEVDLARDLRGRDENASALAAALRNVDADADDSATSDLLAEVAAADADATSPFLALCDNDFLRTVSAA